MKSAGVIWISTGHWISLDSTPGRVPLVRPILRIDVTSDVTLGFRLLQAWRVTSVCVRP